MFKDNYLFAPEYLAGFIDGEGCFFIAQVIEHNGLHFRASLSITNTHKDVLLRIKEFLETTGTHVSLKIHPAGSTNNRNRKEYYSLSVYGRYIKCFLPSLIDKLIVKKDQAKSMLEFLDTLDAEKKQEIADRISWFNQGCP